MKTSRRIRPSGCEPMSVDYRGYQVWELPPNGHGLVVLETLGILSGLPAPDGSPEGVHRAIEALKLAYADGKANIAEPVDMRCGAGEFLREGYLASRRALIGPRALFPEPGRTGLRRHRLPLRRGRGGEYGQLDTVELPELRLRRRRARPRA